MLNVLDKARIEVIEGYRNDQVKSLKYYLRRVDQYKRQLAEDVETIGNIEKMTVEEFSKSIYYREIRSDR